MQAYNRFKITHLDETDFLSIAVEALPAAHEPILSDDSMGIAADTAVIT